MRLGFSKLQGTLGCGKIRIYLLRIHYKKKSQKRPCLTIIMRFFSYFIYKGICCGYSFELHRLVDAIQMSTHNICLYKEVKKKYTGCNLKTTEFLDCALIGICAVIRSNTVVIIICTVNPLYTDTRYKDKIRCNYSNVTKPSLTR